tara:strand:- start:1643 stop:1822 length:180 start_codon:yes stop_codon:yes gene_type:complete
MELRELTQALAAGKNVRWSNDGYKVYWQGDMISALYEDNGFNCALHVNEVAKCYIKLEN